MKMLRTLLVALLAVSASAPVTAQSSGPLRIEITEGVIEPLPFAVPDFQAETGSAGPHAAEIARVISADLAGTGLFREIPSSAFISTVTDFGAPVQFADWKAINAQALITGAVSEQGGNITVKFRVYDVFSGAELGQGLQYTGTVQGLRRIAHQVADTVYSRITGESGYFDSRVIFVSEQGPKNARRKSLAVMDYDGANVTFLTGADDLVLAVVSLL